MLFRSTQPGTGSLSDIYTVDLTNVVGATGSPENFVEAINALAISNVTAAISDTGEFTITHATGGDIVFLGDISGSPLANLGIDVSVTNVFEVVPGLDAVVGTNWKPLVNVGYAVSSSTPYANAPDGTLWYNNSLTRVDILINTGTEWKGYRNVTTDVRGYNL